MAGLKVRGSNVSLWFSLAQPPHVQPTFAVTTATVANPREHACELLGVPDVTGEGWEARGGWAASGGWPSSCTSPTRQLERWPGWTAQQAQYLSCSTPASAHQHGPCPCCTALPAVVDEDGSPHGAKSFVLWNPPLLQVGLLCMLCWALLHYCAAS